MDEPVKIVECPRDGWQGLPAYIPAEIKAAYLRRLVAAGFKHIDAVSFVSPTAIPQTADSEQVLELLDAPPDVDIVGIVVNPKGAERAIRTGRVQTLGFPYSVSPTFLARNQHQTQEESLHALAAICALADAAGAGVVAYLSMAFGNPYEEKWSVDEVIDACDRIVGTGVRQISLADTVGLANPALISEVVNGAFPEYRGIEMGLHLHSRPDRLAAKIRAAYEAGCRRFDAAIGGLGGCPFAQDALVGNIPTETLIAELQRLGAQVPELEPLDELLRATAEMAREFSARTTATAAAAPALRH